MKMKIKLKSWMLLGSLIAGCSSNSRTDSADGMVRDYLTVGATIYNNGALISPWYDNSGVTHKLNSASPLYNGLDTLTVTYSAWSYLMFMQSGSGVTGNDSISFYAWGGTNTTSPNLYMELAVNGNWGTQVNNIATYCDGKTIPTNAWTHCLIPFSALGMTTSSAVDGIFIAEGSGKAWKQMAFSTIQLTQSGSQGTGGASSTGGSLSTGGTPATGGSPSTGGSLATGGNVSTGGSPSTGGDQSTGGTPATGGNVSTGGDQNTGGDQSTGGSLATGGDQSTGGDQNTGGTPATGGSPSTGGSLATGGDQSTGGSPSTGGSLATGGNLAVTTYTPPQYLPANSDGVPSTVQWIHCATMIVKDKLGVDLVALFRGNNSLHAAVSVDGISWSWINPTSTIDIDPPLVIAQSDDGNLHVVSWSYSRGASYARVALSRDGNGNVIGLSSASSRIAFPFNVTFGDMSADLVAGYDQSGNPTLLYSIYDNGSGNNGGRVMVGKTKISAGVSPTVSSDFVSLTNTAGATQLDTMSGSWATPHNAGVLMAQHPVSKDIWFQWGPMNTGDGLTQNNLPLKRLRATPSGTTFTAGSAQTIATFSNGSGVQNYEVINTPSSVWFLYGTATSALNFDKVDANGLLTSNAIPSPYTMAQSGGFFTASFNSTETQIWLAGQAGLDTNDPNRMKTWAKYWNGSTWTSYNTVIVTDNLFRMGRSSGWGNGLAFFQSHFDYTTWKPVMGSLSTN